MEEEPVQTFMTVTNTPRAFALEKLQAHEGDLNEAINAFFNEEEQNVRLQEHHEARRTTLLEKDEPGEVEMESLFQSFPSVGSFFSPFAGFNRGYASNIFSGRRAFLNSTRNLEPQVSHPREVREIPIVCNDNDGSAYSNSAPSIVEIPADTVTEPGSEVKGNVIVEDDDIPCTASAVSMEDSYARGIHDPVIDIDDRDPRTSVPQITEVPVDSNVGGNAAEEEILEAAIEASKREAEAANRRLQHGQPQDILGVRTVQCTSRSEDDELAQAIALSLKTAELERALHECQGLVRSLEQVKDNNNSFVGEQGCTSMGRRQGLGSANVVTSSQVKLDVEESGRDGDYLDVFNARLQEDPDGLEHLIGHVQHTPSGSSGSAMNKCQDFESLMLSPEPRDAGSAAQQCGDPFPAKEETKRQQEAKKVYVPPEPAAEDEDAVTLLVRMPDGSRHGRRFLGSDRLQSLFSFIDVSGGAKPGSYRLIGQLSALVRTGFWLTDMGQDQLDIQIEGETSLDALKQQIGELILAIRLKEKKVVANVTIDACQWLPHSMEIKVLGQIHRWEYKDWRAIGCGINQKFPHSCVYHPAGGGRHSYTVSYSTLNSRGKDGEDKVDIDNLYSFPKTSLIPRYNKYYPQTSIDIGCPPAVKMIRANSGQLLVRPLVDNQDIGYFVLDTGASGLSICPKQVELLRMEAFGEVFITGFDGQVKSRFCRGKTFQLGPLIIKSPLFMEVSLDNLVTGVEEVVGVCGFDVFYHSIVEISCEEGQVSLFDYSHYENTLMEATKWERICFLQNVPNVPVKINGQDSILLIDTGAGGVDVIFHSKAKRYSNLQFEGLASVKGINSTNGGLQVHAVIIDTLEIASHSFKEVQAVYLSGSGNQLHLSEYTSGVLCAELLAKCTVIFDYSRCRMALVGMKSNHA